MKKLRKFERKMKSLNGTNITAKNGGSVNVSTGRKITASHRNFLYFIVDEIKICGTEEDIKKFIVQVANYTTDSLPSGSKCTFEGFGSKCNESITQAVNKCKLCRTHYEYVTNRRCPSVDRQSSSYFNKSDRKNSPIRQENKRSDSPEQPPYQEFSRKKSPLDRRSRTRKFCEEESDNRKEESTNNPSETLNEETGRSESNFSKCETICSSTGLRCRNWSTKELNGKKYCTYHYNKRIDFKEEPEEKSEEYSSEVKFCSFIGQNGKKCLRQSSKESKKGYCTLHSNSYLGENDRSRNYDEEINNMKEQIRQERTFQQSRDRRFNMYDRNETFEQQREKIDERKRNLENQRTLYENETREFEEKNRKRTEESERLRQENERLRQERKERELKIREEQKRSFFEQYREMLFKTQTIQQRKIVFNNLKKFSPEWYDEFMEENEKYTYLISNNELHYSTFDLKFPSVLKDFETKYKKFSLMYHPDKLKNDDPDRLEKIEKFKKISLIISELREKFSE